MNDGQTETVLSGPDLRTPSQILADWKALIQEERISERSCLKHKMPDQSKWHEGKADAIERCADQLEFLILGRFLEPIGELADKADNFFHASTLSLPNKIHVEALQCGMEDIRDALKEFYIDATGKNPWEDQPTANPNG